MGILNKIFGKKNTKESGRSEKIIKEVKKVEPIEVDKLEESRTTLRYDEQVITLEAFRAGIRQGARIQAYRNGGFIPLRNLGDDLLISNGDDYIPLQQSTNPQHEDVKRYVFGG